MASALTTELDVKPPKPALPGLCLYGDPILRRKSAPIPEITAEHRDFAAMMVAAMFEYDGIGLAAPQVGRSLRLVVINTAHCGKGETRPLTPGEMLLNPRMPVVLLNPEILSFSRETDVAEEGCLSLPAIHGDVTRPANVVLRAQLLNGDRVEVPCGGMLARCLQHEVDHLDGIVFSDRLTDVGFAEVEDRLKALEKETKRRLKRRGG